MWRRSFQRAMGLPEQNAATEVDHQLAYFCSLSASKISVAYDRSSSSIAALLVLAPGEVEHLYVGVDYQSKGVGSSLLNLAKEQSAAGLVLYTFEKNVRAQRFYEGHGFVEVARGYAKLEDNPWATSTGELADIKYRWTP